MSLLNTILLIAGLILLGLLFVMAGIWMVVGALNPQPSESQTRIKKILGKKTRKDDAFSQWLEEQADADAATENQKSIIQALGKKYGLARLMAQAGVETDITKYVTLFMIVPLIIGLFLFSQPSVPFLAAIMVSISPGLAIGYLLMKKSGRYKLLEQQLPDALNIMTGSLRAGHAFASAISMMATEMVAPIKPILQNVSNDMQLGIPVSESLRKMTEEVRIADYQIFATAVIVQRETGGNLAEIMDQLATTIRDRAKMKRQIGVLTSQTRLSAYIVAAGPVLMYVIMQFIMPGYTQTLENHALGPLVIGACVVVNILGFLVMRQIVNIRI